MLNGRDMGHLGEKGRGAEKYELAVTKLVTGLQSTAQGL